VRIAIHGATGRMGRELVRLIHAAKEDQLVGAVAAADAPEQGRDIGEVVGVGALGVSITSDLASGFLGANVVIDFSTAAAVPALTRVAARAKVPLVSGTTALGETGQAAIAELTHVAPVLWSPNMSLGVEVLSRIVRMAVEQLGDEYDAEIVETHHRDKVDAPSGTALRLAEAVRLARTGQTLRHGREGAAGPRRKSELGMLAVRGGDVVGDHTVHLLGNGERLELTHRATQRDMFARGALRAAHWIVGKPPGRYTLGHVLG
jgi:4-hydroxy-tetrahydrodipicolinate reductase